MSGNVFGGFGDAVNLKSQFSACSHGKFSFAPAQGSSVTNGVLDITINENLTSNYNAATAKVVQAVAAAGFTEAQDYDHLVVCLPPGSGTWLAYAFIGSSVSVYNDMWCSYVSALMHEIGHNLGFMHSGQGNTVYGDQVGMLGYSYGEDDAPLMCFNGAKSYATNWYHTCDVSITSQQTLKLSNVVDDPQGAAYCTIIRIKTGSSDAAYYVQYNRKKGMNAGTKEAQNKVAVTFASSIFDVSDLVAALAPGDSFALTPSTTAIQVGSTASASGIDYVTVTIGGGGAPNPAPAPDPAPAPNPAPAPSPSPNNCEKFVVQMFDSYGDGWNGNTLVIKPRPPPPPPPAQERSYSLQNGHSYTSQEFCLDPGCYDVTCDGGAWKSEVSWKLKKVGGGVKLSGGAPFDGDHCAAL
jgi:hypothetical protein